MPERLLQFTTLVVGDYASQWARLHADWQQKQHFRTWNQGHSRKGWRR